MFRSNKKIELSEKKRDIAVNCLTNSLDKRWMLLDYMNDLSIMETNKRGTISFGGGKIPEVLRSSKLLNKG